VRLDPGASAIMCLEGTCLPISEPPISSAKRFRGLYLYSPPESIHVGVDKVYEAVYDIRMNYGAADTDKGELWR
jgi:hypothetical protein